MFTIFKLLQSAMLSSEYIKSKSGEEIAKCCNVFSDYNGKYIMRFIGYLELIGAISKFIDYEELIQSKTNIEFANFYNSEKRKIFKKDDSYFIDYKKRNEYIEEFEAEYKEIREELLEEIKNLIPNTDNIEEKGIAFWDLTVTKKEEQMQKLGKAFKEIYEKVKDEIH